MRFSPYQSIYISVDSADTVKIVNDWLSNNVNEGYSSFGSYTVIKNSTLMTATDFVNNNKLWKTKVYNFVDLDDKRAWRMKVKIRNKAAFSFFVLRWGT